MWTRLRAGVSRLVFALARRRLDDEARLRDRRAPRSADRALRPPGHVARRGLRSPRGVSSATRALVRQDIHDMNGIGWIDRLLRICATRCGSCARSPGFAGVVVGHARPRHRRRDGRVQRRPGGAAGAAAVRAARTAGPLLPAGPGQPRHAERARGARTSRSCASTRVVRGRRGARALLRNRPRPGDRRAAPSGCGCCACRAATSARCARRPRLAAASTATTSPAPAASC